LQIINKESGLSCPELKESAQSLNELTYVRQEIKNPLNGIRFAHKLLESSEISASQRQFLETSDACEKQITTIIESTDLKSIEEG